jgi:protein-ribulosamine 3-kinase
LDLCQPQFLYENEQMESKIKKRIEEIISQALNKKISGLQFNPVGGGSINQTFQIVTPANQRYCCKINSVQRFPLLFTKEKNGLEFLANQHIIRVPRIIACEESEGTQVLIMEWIGQGLETEQCWRKFGEQLAALHKITWLTSDQQNWFGLNEDNYMGALPQSNTPSKTWVEFFIHQRMEPQIKLAVDNDLLDGNAVIRFNNLYKNLSDIFTDERSSLLHGDLWKGNFLCDQRNQPVLIDPAVYFGHRSIDLAMTTLFGGFDKTFYEVYDYYFSLPKNHRTQWQICNLYPLLIHLNLFGQGYRLAILNTIAHF